MHKGRGYQLHEYATGIVMGVGELAIQRYCVVFSKITCEIKERHKEIPRKETSVSGDKRRKRPKEGKGRSRA